MNFAHYSNPKYDSLLQQGRQEMDPVKRAAIYGQLQQIVVDDAPWVLISHGMDMAAQRPDVQGFQLHPTGIHWLRMVSKP